MSSIPRDIYLHYSIFQISLFYQQKLTELRQWSEKVRNFDRSYITENGMFYIDCSAIHEGLLPRLNDIYQELITFVGDEARSLAKSFAEEMNVILKVGLIFFSKTKSQNSSKLLM